MKITEVRITKFDGEGALQGFANITFDNLLVVKGVRILEGKKGNFIGMPSQKGADGEYYDNVFPLTKKFREEIADAVLEAFEEEAEKPKKKSYSRK